MACCKKCGAELPEGANFCMKCGAKVLNICPECGKELPADAAFCYVCGTKVSSEPVSSAQESLPADEASFVPLESADSSEPSDADLPDPAVDLAGYVEALMNPDYKKQKAEADVKAGTGSKGAGKKSAAKNEDDDFKKRVKQLEKLFYEEGKLQEAYEYGAEIDADYPDREEVWQILMALWMLRRDFDDVRTNIDGFKSAFPNNPFTKYFYLLSNFLEMEKTKNIDWFISFQEEEFKKFKWNVSKKERSWQIKLQLFLNKFKKTAPLTLDEETCKKQDLYFNFINSDFSKKIIQEKGSEAAEKNPAYHYLPAGKYEIKIDETCENGSGMNSVVVDSKLEKYLKEEGEGPLSFYEKNYKGDSFCQQLLEAGESCGNLASGISPAMMKKNGSKLKVEISGITDKAFKLNLEISDFDDKLKKVTAKFSDGSGFGVKIHENQLSEKSSGKKYEAARVYQAWFNYQLESSEDIALEELLVLEVIKDNRFEKLPSVYINGFLQQSNFKCTGCWTTEYPVREYINHKIQEK